MTGTDLKPADEAGRLAAVHRYDVLDSPPDGAFERITALAARIFDVPIAIVSIVDSDRIWFKSHHGLDVEQIDREPGLCASAILHDGPWLVNDAALDPRALSNPLVAGDFGLRFYAGIPLTTHDGFNLGTLCVIDREPREVSEAELDSLADLSSIVLDELELRLEARRVVTLEAQLRRSAEEVASTLQQNLLPPQLPAIAGLELAARYHAAHRDTVGGDFYDVVADDDGSAALVIGDACGKGTRAAALTGTARWTIRTIALADWTPVSALTRLNAVLVRESVNPSRYLTLALASVRPLAAGGADLVVGLAGHPHPLLVRRDGRVERTGLTAPVVGWSAAARFSEVAVRMSRGDVLVLFTDGMLEIVAGHGITDDALLQALLAPLAGRSATAVADRLDAAIGEGELTDDAAFLVVGCP